MDAKNIQFTNIEIRIAKYLFKHYKEKHNARQLAKLLDINHAHANKLCNILTEKKLLKKEHTGNATYFSYDYNNHLAIKFMEYMLSLEEKEMPKWLAVALYNLSKLKPYIKIGAIFGSSIKTKTFNDIDVLLVYEKEKLKDIATIKEEIRKQGTVEKPIRYVEIAEKDILSNKEDKIFYSMLSENLIFHNPEKYAEAIRKCHK